jgi:hypothetical protein
MVIGIPTVGIPTCNRGRKGGRGMGKGGREGEGPRYQSIYCEIKYKIG